MADHGGSPYVVTSHESKTYVKVPIFPDFVDNFPNSLYPPLIHNIKFIKYIF